MKTEKEIRVELKRLESQYPRMLTQVGQISCEAGMTFLRWVLENTEEADGQ